MRPDVSAIRCDIVGIFTFRRVYRTHGAYRDEIRIG